MNIRSFSAFKKLVSATAAAGAFALLTPLASVGQTATATANALLFALDLPGTDTTVKWTNLSNSNLPLTPTSGTGTIAVGGGGGSFSAGFYSFSGDFNSTLTSSTVAFDINTVVVQYVAMRVVGEGYDLSVADHLAYGGGPVLTYTLSGGGTGTVSATFSGTLGGPISGSGGGFVGDYYNFAWQFDLSSVVGVVTSVSVVTPLHIHQSTIGASLSIGDAPSGNLVASAIPEPSTYVAIAGAVALAGACIVRRRRNGRGAKPSSIRR